MLMGSLEETCMLLSKKKLMVTVIPEPALPNHMKRDYANTRFKFC